MVVMPKHVMTYIVHGSMLVAPKLHVSTFVQLAI